MRVQTGLTTLGILLVGLLWPTSARSVEMRCTVFDANGQYLTTEDARDTIDNDGSVQIYAWSDYFTYRFNLSPSYQAKMELTNVLTKDSAFLFADEMPEGKKLTVGVKSYETPGASLQLVCQR